MIPFYYFYTPDYEFWNVHLQHTLSSHFDVRPLKIESLPLSDAAVTGHHFVNCTTKIELLIECIEKNKEKHIVFTDCTIFVDLKNAPHLSQYMSQYFKKDMTFIYYKQDNRNIAIILLHCNENVLAFWKAVLHRMKEVISQNKNVWDQAIVNQMLDGEYSWLKCGYFDDKIWIGGEIPKGTPFYFYKATCDPNCDRQRARLTYLYQSELLSQSCYEYWVNYRPC